MAKYMVLFNSTMTAAELMANATPEQMQTSMGEWMQWRDEAVKTVKFEFGLPLQATDRITPEGITANDNRASGYSIMEGESKEEIVRLLKLHPHLEREGATIDLFEMLHMPGM